MMDIPTKNTGPPSRRASSQKKALHWMLGTFLAWIFVYLVLQGQDGFFARTVDRIELYWVKLIFLNMPLQILLTFVMAVCAASKRSAVLRVGIWVGVVNSILIFVHLILSVATA